MADRDDRGGRSSRVRRIDRCDGHLRRAPRSFTCQPASVCLTNARRRGKSIARGDQRSAGDALAIGTFQRHRCRDQQPNHADRLAQPGAAPATDIAPRSAEQFDLHNQVINIGFPLRSDTDYHYRDNYLEKRDGPPDPYNHAKEGPDGQLIRLHDGIDIYAPENEPVLSPFDGTVIDPATKWQPWQPDRYGLTVVVQSDEPTSTGYMAVLVHLSKSWVAVGQHVTRGQVIGTLGRTGDAQDVRPQLHIELRAPFLIDWSTVGEDGQVDAFNPYPSLVAADPKT